LRDTLADAQLINFNPTTFFPRFPPVFRTGTGSPKLAWKDVDPRKFLPSPAVPTMDHYQSGEPGRSTSGTMPSYSGIPNFTLAPATTLGAPIGMTSPGNFAFGHHQPPPPPPQHQQHHAHPSHGEPLPQVMPVQTTAPSKKRKANKPPPTMQGPDYSQGQPGMPGGPSPTTKKSRTNTPWTPEEEQRLKMMRDAGASWSEIAKTFPTRTEGSVKKHWYKDMHYAEFAQDEVRSDFHDPFSTALLAAIKEYEANKWKIIGQKVGKPAKACEQYAKEHFGGRV